MLRAQTNSLRKNIANILEKFNEIAEILVGNFSNVETNVFEEFSENVIIASFDYLTAFIDLYPEKFNMILSNFISQLPKTFGNV